MHHSRIVLSCLTFWFTVGVTVHRPWMEAAERSTGRDLESRHAVSSPRGAAQEAGGSDRQAPWYRLSLNVIRTSATVLTVRPCASACHRPKSTPNWTWASWRARRGDAPGPSPLEPQSG